MPAFVYRELLEAGVSIHEYRPAFLHAKLATIDGSIAMIGSRQHRHPLVPARAEVSVLIYAARWLNGSKRSSNVTSTRQIR